MSGYIKVDALRNAMYHEAFETDTEMQRWDSGCWIRYKLFENILEQQPTADVVEVVRCKYCKHFHDGIYNGEYWMECDEYRIALSSDEWFCADGKRREDVRLDNES